MRTFLIILLIAFPASGEVIGWRTDATDVVDTFELCGDGPCVQIGYSRWHAPFHKSGDVYVYRADVELKPGVQYWVQTKRNEVVILPDNMDRIWCSPWDFNGDGIVGAFDLSRWLFSWFFGGGATSINEFGNGRLEMGRICNGSPA